MSIATGLIDDPANCEMRLGGEFGERGLRFPGVYPLVLATQDWLSACTQVHLNMLHASTVPNRSVRPDTFG